MLNVHFPIHFRVYQLIPLDNYITSMLIKYFNNNKGVFILNLNEGWESANGVLINDSIQIKGAHNPTLR